MNINELLAQLNQTVAQLDEANINDDTRFDLEGLIIDTKRAIIRHSVDPLRDISQMTVVDVSQLRTLTPQLQQVIADEQKRTALVTRIISIAKAGLKGAGLPIP